MSTKKSAVFAFFVSPCLVLAGCSAPEQRVDVAVENELSAPLQQQVLTCVAKDPKQFASVGNLGAALGPVELTAVGSLLKMVYSLQTPGSNASEIRLLSESPADFYGSKIEASFDEGDGWLKVQKVGTKFVGTLTVQQDFPFAVDCSLSSRRSPVVATTPVLVCFPNDANQFSSEGDLAASLGPIEIYAVGRRLNVEYDVQPYGGGAGRIVRFASDNSASLRGDKISAAFNDGEDQLRLEKSGSGYRGTFTVEQDFPFDVECKIP